MAKFYLGIRNSRTFSLAMKSGLPPRIMSVPRPAIFVAIVTDPIRPLWETISASLSAFSGFAFRTWNTPTAHEQRICHLAANYSRKVLLKEEMQNSLNMQMFPWFDHETLDKWHSECFHSRTSPGLTHPISTLLYSFALCNGYAGITQILIKAMDDALQRIATYKQILKRFETTNDINKRLKRVLRIHDR